MKTQIKTIDIQAKEWFDAVNGNSYFAGIVTTDFGTDQEKVFKMPFQYGYERAYEQEAKSILLKQGLIDTTNSHELREKGIVINASIQEKCGKMAVKAYGE